MIFYSYYVITFKKLSDYTERKYSSIKGQFFGSNFTSLEKETLHFENRIFQFLAHMALATLSIFHCIIAPSIPHTLSDVDRHAPEVYILESSVENLSKIIIL